MDNPYYFLEGGGDMGLQIRNKDWTQTPLGSPDTWPQNLQSAVSIILNNPFPMYIAWGKEYRQIFNDAYVPILGHQKEIDALGKSTSETFSEVWHITEPIFKAVERGESVGFSNFMFPLLREGSIQNCYFDLAYSPIFLQDRSIGGILITIFETTAKNLADEELNKSEKRFKAIADNIPNLAWMADAKGDLYWYNKQWYDYTGTTFEEMKGWGWKSVYREEQLVNILKEWKLSLEKCIPFEMSYPIKGANGNYEQFLTRALPVKNEEGEITTWFGTNTNITSQKAIEQALDDSKKELEFVIEAAALGTFDYNPITNKFSANTRLKEWFGLSADQEVDLDDATKVIVEEHQENVLSAIAKALDFSSGGFYDIAYNIVNPNSKNEITLHAKGKVLFDDNKMPFRFNGTVEDITAQNTARKQLEQSENNLKSIILQAPMAIAILRGPEYVVEIANESALNLWGKTLQDVNSISIFESIPELSLQGVKEILNSVRASGKHLSTTELPLKIMRSGTLETVYMNFSYEPIYDDHSNSNKIMVLGYDVTPQVIARKEIEKSEQSIRSLVESAPFPIAVYTGSEMRITLANQSMVDAWGKGSDVIGKLYRNLLPELENQNIYEQIETVYKTGIAFNAINQRVALLKDGFLKNHYFNYSFTPLKDSGGLIYGVMNTAAEVTELNEVKEKIEESEKRFRDAVHQAPVAMIIVRGPENIVNMVNKPYLELVDKSTSDLLSRPIFEALPDAEEIISPIFKEIYRTGEAFHGYEFPVTLTRLGKKENCYFNFVYHPLLDGNMVTGIMVVATDVTANVTAKKLLEENEQKFRLLADSMPQFVWTADERGKLNYFNQAVFNFSGYTKEEIVEKGWLSIVHDDEREENTKRWMDAIATEKDFIIEHRFRKSDGTYRWQLTRAIPQRDKKGKITMWVGTSTDIQDQKMFTSELEREVLERTKELFQKNDDLEKMNKELQSFAYISSHDLQEPLRKIQTFATQLREREYENISDRGKDKFIRMQSAADRMQTLIQDLLAYSRTSVQERIFEKANISTIVEEVKEDLEYDFEGRNTTIEIVNDFKIDVIPVQFRQVLFNLITNSLKFTKPDSDAKITIDSLVAFGSELDNSNLKPDVEYCCIIFTDNGIGFEEEYSEKIFQVFQRLHGKEKFQGTGIGLAIVKRIVENHEGIITAHGLLNEGATFKIFIPTSH